MLKWIFRAVVALAVIAAVGAFAYRDRISQLLAVNSLFAPDKIVANFSAMPDLFFSTELPRGDGPVSPLPEGEAITLPAGFDNWITERNVTSIVVLHEGEIVHEDYYLGTGPDERRISWSVAKSYLATVFGTAVDRGEIASLDDPVTDYAPSLVGTAYDGATIRNVLNMSSGVTFNEDYFDQSSDINRMGRVLALGRSMDAFTEDLTETFTQPGDRFQYVSIDTHVVGMVLRGATGESVADLLTERVLKPLGLEQDGAYITDGYGVAFALGGLNFTTRDYARFGQMVLNGGTWQGQRIVSQEWLTESTRASANTEPGKRRYGYQWWMPSDIDPANPTHEYMGMGIYGQYLFFDPEAGVLIAQNGADAKFREDGVIDENIAMWRAIVDATAN
ncbi:MAG: serine hydrolase [Pseudomonadota bacterium]